MEAFEQQQHQGECNKPHPVSREATDLQRLVVEHADLWSAVRKSLTQSWFVRNGDAERLCTGLIRGLVCKSYVRDSTLLSLPPKVDHAWHQAILNTFPYRQMCKGVFGRILEHTTLTSSDTWEEKNGRIDATIVLYR